MEQNEIAPVLGLAAAIKAQKGARGMSNKELSARSEIPLGTINRMLSNDPREIYLGQIHALARVFGMTPAQLVEQGDEQLDRLLSEAADTTDELAERRRKQDEAARMTPEELERQKSAATRDRELDTDEPDVP